MLFRSNDTATTEIYTLSLHDALPILVGIVAGERATQALDSGRRVGRQVGESGEQLVRISPPIKEHALSVGDASRSPFGTPLRASSNQIRATAREVLRGPSCRVIRKECPGRLKDFGGGKWQLLGIYEVGHVSDDDLWRGLTPQFSCKRVK